MYRQRLVDSMRQAEEDLAQKKIIMNCKTTKNQRETCIKQETERTIVKRGERIVTKDLYDRSLISQVKLGKGPIYEQFKDRIESTYVVDRSDPDRDKKKLNKRSAAIDSRPKFKKWTAIKIENRTKEKDLEDQVAYWRRMSNSDGIENPKPTLLEQSRFYSSK